MSRDVHALAPSEFLEEVHSFEFWLHSVEGYLADTEFGHRPETRDTELPPERRERLITVLCNYSIGETAALEGAAADGCESPDHAAERLLEFLFRERP